MSPFVAYAIVPLAAAAIAFVLSPLAARLSIWSGAVDHPDDRKIHRQPMPRLGGLAVLASVAIVLGGAQFVPGVIWRVPSALLGGLLLGLIPIAAISLVDDIRSVRASIKFLFHLIGASISVAAGISLPEHIQLLGHTVWIGYLAAPISVLWLAGVTNAFNIVDGLDGLAAGLAFISALAMSAVFFVVGQFSSALVPLALAGALAGFLPYNLYPARMFLGDTGATAIGFCLAAITLKGGSTMSAGFAAAMPILLMGLPIADTLISISRRLVRKGERAAGGVFQADRNHIHHRLLALGLDHRKAVFILYGTGALMATVAFVSLFITHRESALLLFALLTAGFIGVKRLGYDEFAVVRRGTILRIYEAPVLKRSMFVVFVDMSLVTLSVYAAVGLKTDDWALSTHGQMTLQMAAFMAPLTVLAFWRGNLYQGSWRLATIDDYVRASAASGGAVILALLLLSWQLQLVPAALLVVYGLVSSMLLVGSRASYRILVSAQRRTRRTGTPVLLCGPGPEDLVAARDLIDRAASLGLRPVGLICAQRELKGRLLAGLKIWGTIDELPKIVRQSTAQAVLIAQTHVQEELLGRIVSICQESHVALYRLNVELEYLSGDPVRRPLEESIDVRNLAEGVVCPECGSRSVRRSRARGLEFLRKKLTHKRIFRCELCQWRGWREPGESRVGLAEYVNTPLDLTALDSTQIPKPGPHQEVS